MFSVFMFLKIKAFDNFENLSCVPLGQCGGMNRRKKIAYGKMKSFFFRRLVGVFRGIWVLEMGRMKTKVIQLLSNRSTSLSSLKATSLSPLPKITEYQPTGLHTLFSSPSNRSAHSLGFGDYIGRNHCLAG